MAKCKIKRAIIIGAGPGGLTAAIALRQAGIQPVIYERAREIGAVGSGLTLWPNVIQALDTLTLAEAVCSSSQPLAGLAMRHWHGQRLFYIPPAVMEHRFGGSGRALHRAELVDVLFKALGDDVVHRGARCIGFRSDEVGVTAFFEDGSEAHGEVLIGADGIRSTIRTHLFGKMELRYAGFTVWRGVADFELEPKTGATSLGRGAQFGMFALPRNRVYWFASTNTPAGAQDGPSGRKKELLERFADWHEPIKAILEATNEATILRNDIYDLNPLNRWSDGRVTLLGDAAHPFAPTLGQGACQAIEDAVVLVNCLCENHDIALALKAYQARRVQRTKAITTQSRWIGQIGQWENPAACWLRDRLIKRTPESMRLKQLEWMFRFEP